jgi:fused signal recognition particle receptor
MVFWRKKKNEGAQDKAEAEDRLVHHAHDPAIAPPTEYDASIDSEFSHHELAPTESEILETAQPLPTPEHSLADAIRENQELKDHSSEGGWFSRLTDGLSKSAGKLSSGISDIFTKRRLDEASLSALEDVLIAADLGPKTSSALVASLAARKFEKESSAEDVRRALAEDISAVLIPVSKPLSIPQISEKPFIILVCGVNGAGKTTTIGKLAYQWHMKEHKSVMIAAADTFRAAAVDQLDVWAKRAHVPLIKKDIGADSAAVAYEAIAEAKKAGTHILMIDTAGRLQNKSNLMAELQKVVRAIKKQDDTAPHAVLLVLDATTGQNAHSQVRIFKEAVDVTGLIVTKLDGTARGGVVVSLAQEFALPIHAVGVGETAEDLSPFKARDFANALMGLEN